MDTSVGSALARASRRSKLGRKLSRRLSLVTKVPNMISVRLKQELSGSRDSLRTRRGSQQRNFEITTIAPDKTQRILPASSPTVVRDLIAPIVQEFELTDCRLLLAGSLARVDPDADVSLLEGDILLIEYAYRPQDSRGESDVRFRLTETLLNEEREYSASLGSAGELYGGPLKKLSCLSEEEHYLLFGGLAELAVLSKGLCMQIQETLESWDPETSAIGQFFSKQFWEHYDEYQESYRKARQLLREKTATDDEFVEFCKLRRGAALDTLGTLLDLPVSLIVHFILFNLIVVERGSFCLSLRSHTLIHTIEAITCRTEDTIAAAGVRKS
ncbi:uncharacterized protein [Periplaneta americana]|uniref:uncharacterized protein n=1 Tax=Periplaneta americana TaxID=6978 RepID=UPI0037E902B9